MDELIQLLKKVKPATDFKKEMHLISDEIIDSFDLMEITARINDEYDIEIEAEDLVPENFESVKAIYALICRKKNQ